MVYTNTSISVFKTSAANSTHWTADFICWDGCSDWYGGSIDPQNSNATFGYAASSHPVANKGNANSSIPFHDLARAHFDFDLTKAKRSAADFDTLIKTAGDIVA